MPEPAPLSQRTSGVLLHPTSLPGPHGSGDLGPAAFHFVDWLYTAGQRLWQVLPLNPIGPGNSPYAGVSAFAGNPFLVALEPLVEKGWLAPVNAAAMPAFDAHRVRFGEVMPWRLQQLRQAWTGFKALPATSQDTARWARFCAEQAVWLDDYALFMVLDRVYNPGLPGESFRPWCDWDAGLAQRDPAALAAARLQHADDIGFWQFVQWCFDEQWQAVRRYAQDKGVAIVGDLPIFVAHHSADCWARPDLYWLDAEGQPTVVAGVPPDFFSATGQRWGNPLYRWDRFEQEGFAWWIARIQRQLALADIVRIDHFRGFAAYWEIPADCPTAMDGHWVAAPGQQLFEAVRKALGSLPIIAEDLGVITPDVEALRDGFEFPGMRILQFGFGEEADHPFLPHNYPPNTVVYTGTHDNDTLRGWWASATPRERAFAQAYLGGDDSRVHWEAIRAVLASAANTVIVPFQDVLGLDSRHRMNTPGLMGAWEWRFTWDWVNDHPARQLATLSAAYGRADLAYLQLPEPTPAG